MDSSSSSSKSTDSRSFQNEKNGRAGTFSRKRELDESNLCPFQLLRTFGMNPEVPLINLTTENRTIVAYASSHVVILYNYVSEKTIPLQGHQNAVKTLSTSKDGKWLLSADFENDSAVVVWDTESGVPVCTLFNPHADKELSAARISPSAKYIVTVGNEKQQRVHFWLWTYGTDEPNGYVELTNTSSDRVKEISFNEDFPEEFVLTAEHNVIFFIWDHGDLKHYYPKVFGNIRRCGIFNSTCYVSKTDRALTATTNGYVLVWCKDRRAKIVDNKRRHLKSVRLQKNNITVILNHNGMIVTGTSKGRINFYDLQLRILYWCQNCDLDYIESISFDLHSSLMAPVPIDQKSELEHTKEEDIEYDAEFEECIETKMEDTIGPERMKYLKQIELKLSIDEKNEGFMKPPHMPIDPTSENTSFHVANFFVGCSSGLMGFIEIPTLKCRHIMHNVGGAITSLDCHPRSNYLVTGNANGLMCLYDYENQKLIIRRKTPPLPDFRLLLDDQMKTANITYVTCPQSHEKLTAITVLKYSPLSKL